MYFFSVKGNYVQTKMDKINIGKPKRGEKKFTKRFPDILNKLKSLVLHSRERRGSMYWW